MHPLCAVSLPPSLYEQRLSVRQIASFKIGTEDSVGPTACLSDQSSVSHFKLLVPLFVASIIVRVKDLIYILIYQYSGIHK
jgi:hypothetical protein